MTTTVLCGSDVATSEFEYGWVHPDHKSGFAHPISQEKGSLKGTQGEVHHYRLYWTESTGANNGVLRGRSEGSRPSRRVSRRRVGRGACYCRWGRRVACRRPADGAINPV